MTKEEKENIEQALAAARRLVRLCSWPEQDFRSVKWEITLKHQSPTSKKRHTVRMKGTL